MDTNMADRPSAARTRGGDLTTFEDPKARARSRCRRPIQDDETEGLEALGALLSALRQKAGVTDRDLAAASQVSERHLQRLRAGVRRTRASTLERIARALAPRLYLDPLELHDTLVMTAGRALAPESEFRGRVDRRRQRRLDRELAKEATRQRRIAALRERFGDLGAKPAR